MSLESRQIAVTAWIAALTGVAPVFVTFKNEANRVTKGQAVDLSWVSDVSVGVDEVRLELDDTVPAPYANLTPVQLGNRKVSLQVSIETSDQRPAVNARSLFERMRGRMRLPQSLAALAAANIGLVGVGSAINADYNAEGRMFSRVVCEIAMNVTSFERGDTTDQSGTIESVDVSSEYITVGDDPIPTPEQVIHEVMP